jgi:hypothetical protein
VGLRVLDTSPLGGFGRLGLRPLGSGGHERYQRITHGLLHGIFGSTVEREAQFSVLDASAGRPTTPRRAGRAQLP